MAGSTIEDLDTRMVPHDHQLHVPSLESCVWPSEIAQIYVVRLLVDHRHSE
jgi:hypothetical protein